jgi:hypothetical protein
VRCHSRKANKRCLKKGRFSGGTMMRENNTMVFLQPAGGIVRLA